MIRRKISDLRQKYFSEIALLLVTLIWGGTFSIIKESLHDMSSMLFVGVRFLIAALVMLPIMFVKRDVFNKKAVFSGILLGFFMFMGFILQTVGLKYTTATKSGFITGTLVVMIPFLQTFIEKRPPTKGAIVGTVLVFIGIVFLTTGGSNLFVFLNQLGSNFNIGDLLTLFCAVFFALYVVYLDIITNKYDFWLLVFLQIATTSVLGFVSAVFFSTTGIEEIHFEYSNYLLFGLLYTALLASLAATLILTKFQKNVSPTKAGIIYSFEPVFGAIFAFFLLSEKITNFGIIGSLLIFTGLVVSEVYENWVKYYGKQRIQSEDST
jgi:drug/metabolite transporter (DMT)-like permease